MRKNILVVDRSLLNSRTIGIMYEAFGCNVLLASDVKGAIDVVVLNPIDVVVMGTRFWRESGAELGAALRAVQPWLPVGVMEESSSILEGRLPSADFHVRPTHFFSDLCLHLSRMTDTDEFRS